MPLIGDAEMPLPLNIPAEDCDEEAAKELRRSKVGAKQDNPEAG